jgi:hypothetical protein
LGEPVATSELQTATWRPTAALQRMADNEHTLAERIDFSPHIRPEALLQEAVIAFDSMGAVAIFRDT